MMGVDEKFACEEVLVCIIDQQVERLRKKEVSLAKFLRRNHQTESVK